MREGDRGGGDVGGEQEAGNRNEVVIRSPRPNATRVLWIFPTASRLSPFASRLLSLLS